MRVRDELLERAFGAIHDKRRGITVPPHRILGKVQNSWDTGAGFGGFFDVKKALFSLFQKPEKKTPKNFKKKLSNIDEVPA